MGESGTTVNLLRTGPRGGTPVVLLHSAGLELSYWDHQVGALCGDHDVVLVDLPGHGRTPGGPEDWTPQAATDFVTGVLDGLDTRTVHLVGLSLGGLLAQSVTLADPSRIASLTLIDTAASFAAPGRAAMRSRAASARADGMAAVIDSLIDHWFTAQTRTRRPDLVDRTVKTLLGDDPQVHAAVWEMIADFDTAAQLPRIPCPTLVLVGELDSSSPVAAARQLRDGIPRARMRTIPHTAHLAPLEKPELVTAHLTEFLAAIS